jgi:hypothetical protein
MINVDVDAYAVSLASACTRQQLARSNYRRSFNLRLKTNKEVELRLIKADNNKSTGELGPVRQLSHEPNRSYTMHPMPISKCKAGKRRTQSCIETFTT